MISSSAPLQDSTNVQVRRSLKIIILISILYLILVSISISTLIIIGVIIGCVAILIKLKISQIRKKGPQNFSPKLRKVLFQKSIFDIYSDIIYFPTISKIIAAFIKPLITKPHPQDLPRSFTHIPKKAKQIISTKGLINIFPQKIRALGYKQHEPLPKIKHQWKWYNSQKYKLHDQVHEDTLSKRIMERIDQKVDWKMLLMLMVLLGYGIKNMDYRKVKKIFIQNGCVIGVMMVVVVGLIKLKNKKYIKNKASDQSLAILGKQSRE